MPIRRREHFVDFLQNFISVNDALKVQADRRHQLSARLIICLRQVWLAGKQLADFLSTEAVASRLKKLNLSGYAVNHDHVSDRFEIDHRIRISIHRYVYVIMREIDADHDFKSQIIGNKLKPSIGIVALDIFILRLYFFVLINANCEERVIFFDVPIRDADRF